jgi:ATP-dependent Clp protease protease subunit
MEGYKILEGEIGWDIALNDVANKDKFIINSYGGDLDAGYAIHDYLKTNKNSEVGVMGVCASSATLILLGASKRWGTKNSQFLIHNP